MMDGNELTSYMSERIDALVSGVLRSSLRDPRETAFLLRFGTSVKKADTIRRAMEEDGEHVPAFLISSITTSCNLFCKGCYARANGICGTPLKVEMSADDWGSVFEQAEGLGIPFNILAGGEPLMRRDVIMRASAMKNTVFPVFTNGTVIDEDYMELFGWCRNLIPVFSIEGDRAHTDGRRGEGTYDMVVGKMGELGKRGLFFGASVTVMKGCEDVVASEDFVMMLHDSGCKIVFFIEFVPVCGDPEGSAPTEDDRARFRVRLSELRRMYGDMIFMSFPGDEEYLGGCIGAGRGFFHINPYGDAEACPASPYSDINVREGTLKDVLSSRLFSDIRSEGLLRGEHVGGCILIDRKDEIQSIIDGHTYKNIRSR